MKEELGIAAEPEDLRLVGSMTDAMKASSMDGSLRIMRRVMFLLMKSR